MLACCVVSVTCEQSDWLTDISTLAILFLNRDFIDSSFITKLLYILGGFFVIFHNPFLQ